jgi:hypothetical protein
MTSNEFIGYALIAIAALAVSIIFWRLTLSIPTHIRHQKAILRMLSEIAAKNGVDSETIHSINIDAKGPQHP